MEREIVNPNTPFPARLLAGALTLSGFVLVALVWFTFNSYRNSSAGKLRDLRTEELCGVIVHLDEVLTMSARMAAATGDPAWERRYRQFEPQLDAAIKEAMESEADSDRAEAAAQTDAANLALVEMENRSFALVRAGEAGQAKAVLFSPAYEEQKKIYATGMATFLQRLQDQLAADQRQEHREAIFSAIAVTLGIVLLCLTWLAILARLKPVHRQLFQTNRTLQREVVEHTRAEKELQWKTAFLEAQVNSSIDGILVVNQEGKKILQNQKFADLFKIPRHILEDTGDEEQLRWVTAMARDPAQFVEKVLHLYACQNEVSRDEIELSDGMTLDRYSSPVTGHDGAYFGRIWTFRDITERRRAATALEDSGRFLQSTLDALSSHIAILDERGKIIGVNGAWSRFADENGWRGHLRGVGDNYLELCDGAHGRFSDEAHVIAAGIRAVMAGTTAAFDLEYPCHAPSEERWFIARVTRFVADDGVRVVVAHENISARKRAELALKGSEELLRRVMDSSQDCIKILSLEGHLLWMNEGGKTIMEIDDFEAVRNRVWTDLWPAEARGEILKAMALAQRNRVGRFSGFCPTAKGSPRWWEVVVTPVLNDAGEPEKLLSVSRDITARKEVETEVMRAKEAAEAANGAKSEFLANMSHEIRTPMNGILGMTNLVLESSLTTEQRGYLEMANASGKALLGLINNILDFSKIEAGKLELESIDFSLRDAIAHLLKPLVLRAQQKGIELRADIADDVPDHLLGDPLRLRQILLNLADNALKFTERGSVLVKVSTEAEEDGEQCVHFCVEDTGIGIPAAKQEAIFEAFAQVDGSTTRTYGGTGLGLAIASQLVEQMRGKIRIESTLGKGTTFHFTAWFRIPTESSLLREVNGDGSRTEDEDEQKGLRILLAEDNVINRAVATGILAKRGHSLAHAANGREAVEAAAHEAFDLIFMDVQMPEMDGFEATRHIREIETPLGRHTPIVAMTAHAMTGDRERCLAAGMDDYISKPLAKTELFALLERIRSTGVPPAGAPHRPDGCAPPPIFSHEKLLDQLDGDEELLQQMIALFQENTPLLLNGLRDSIAGRRSIDVASSAHALLSSLGAFGALHAHQLTHHLEELGNQNDFNGADTTFADLERETAGITAALDEMTLV